MCIVPEMLQVWTIALFCLAVVVIAGGLFVLFRAFRGKPDGSDDGVEASEDGGREIRFEYLDCLAVSGAGQVRLYCGATENCCRFQGVLPPEAKIDWRNGRLEIRLPRQNSDPELLFEVFSGAMPSRLKGGCGARVELEKAAGEEFNCKLEKRSSASITGGVIQALKIKVAGNSTLEGELDAVSEGKIQVSGGSQCRLAGSISTLKLHLADRSSALIRQVNQARVNVSGGSKLDLTVTEKLRGDVSGASKLRYSGPADVSVRKSGSSKVKMQ